MPRAATRAFASPFRAALALTLLAGLGVPACGDGTKKVTPPAQTALVCESDDECDGGRCDPFAGCVECLFDGDCGTDARCVEQTCHGVVPCADDQDCDSGSCDTDAGRCAECHSDTDCAETERCSDTVCVKSAPCSVDADCGTSLRCGPKNQCVRCVSDQDCGDGTSCREGKCLPHCESSDDCPAVYHCAQATCALDICEPGTSTCSSTGRAKRLCADAGDSFDLSPCGSGRRCGETEGVAECHPLACTPGAWACDEAREQADLCSEDGREVVRRVSCATDGLVCNDGECVPQTCEPGTSRCNGDSIATCDAFGSAEETSACPDGERCEAASTTCVPRVCEPGKGGCLEETQATCDAQGSAYEVTGEDCAASQLACWEGACESVLCDNGFSCIDGDSYECTANRTALTLAQSCTFDNGQFCNAESGQCQEFVCDPGQPTCNGDLATSCANDGSQALDFGVDCAATNKVLKAALQS